MGASGQRYHFFLINTDPNLQESYLPVPLFEQYSMSPSHHSACAQPVEMDCEEYQRRIEAFLGKSEEALPECLAAKDECYAAVHNVIAKVLPVSCGVGVIKVVKAMLQLDPVLFFEQGIARALSNHLPEHVGLGLVRELSELLYCMARALKDRIAERDLSDVLMEGTRACAIAFLLCTEPPFGDLGGIECDHGLANLSNRQFLDVLISHVLPFAATRVSAPGAAGTCFRALLRFLAGAVWLDSVSCFFSKTSAAEELAGLVLTRTLEPVAARAAALFLTRVALKVSPPVPFRRVPLALGQIAADLQAAGEPAGLTEFLRALAWRPEEWAWGDGAGAARRLSVLEAVFPTLLASVRSGDTGALQVTQVFLGGALAAPERARLYERCLAHLGLLDALRAAPKTVEWLRFVEFLARDRVAANLLAEEFEHIECFFLESGPSHEDFLSCTVCNLLAHLVRSERGVELGLPRRMLSGPQGGLVHAYLMKASLNACGCGSAFCAVLVAILKADAACARAMWQSGAVQHIFRHLENMKILARGLARHGLAQHGPVTAPTDFPIPLPPPFIRVLKVLVRADPQLFPQCLSSRELREALIPRSLFKRIPKNRDTARRAGQLCHRFLAGYLRILFAAVSAIPKKINLEALDSEAPDLVLRGVRLATLTAISPIDCGALPPTISPFLLSLAIAVRMLHHGACDPGQQQHEAFLSVVGAPETPLALRLLCLIPVAHVLRSSTPRYALPTDSQHLAGAIAVALSFADAHAQHTFPFNVREAKFFRAEVLAYSCYAGLAADAAAPFEQIVTRVFSDFAAMLCRAPDQARLFRSLPGVGAKQLNILLQGATRPDTLGVAFARLFCKFSAERVHAGVALTLPRFRPFAAEVLRGELTTRHARALEAALLGMSRFKGAASTLCELPELALLAAVGRVATPGWMRTRLRLLREILDASGGARALLGPPEAAAHATGTLIADATHMVQRFMGVSSAAKTQELQEVFVAFLLQLGRTKPYNKLIATDHIRNALATISAGSALRKEDARGMAKLKKLFGL
eukprot:gnl/Chilomastix_cuspidata/5053.p1 GENE.gnl/Chilomastix_cuspidata/5053~~gnl/Chilomastix_cuspidata/5053.p1  ORF type:complete len:1039 (-),score=383.23 gnl/Chilomastix_cuspidata/5053:83-3199(-)